MYVDADFAGWWHKEYSHLCNSVLSRTGFIVLFCRCPISWCSKLQYEIALSTTESEYIALSTATCDIILLWRILQDIICYTFINSTTTNIQDKILSSTFHSSPTIPTSKVYGENNACIVLATPETTFKPCTKHISLKYHHFNDQIKNGTLSIIKVDTNKNWADVFTKPLGRLKFETLHRLIMGW